MPAGYKTNPELGFLPLLAAAPAAIGAVGGIAKGIGGLFKKKKAAAPAPAPSPAKAGSPKTKAAPSKPRGSTIVATSDKQGLTKQDVKDALVAYYHSLQAEKEKQTAMTSKLKASLAPQIATLSKLAKDASLRTQVTSEHNRRVQDETRWRTNREQNAAILKKIGELEASMLADRARKTKAYEIYGVHA